MDLILAVDALHIHKQLVVINTIMDQTQVADVLHILQHHAVVNMGLVLYALHMEHKHVALHIHMLFAVQQDFQHITIHAVKHTLAQVAVHNIIHTMVVFAVPHMFIIHTKVELYVDHIILVL